MIIMIKIIIIIIMIIIMESIIWIAEKRRETIPTYCWKKIISLLIVNENLFGMLIWEWESIIINSIQVNGDYLPSWDSCKVLWDLWAQNWQLGPNLALWSCPGPGGLLFCFDKTVLFTDPNVVQRKLYQYRLSAHQDTSDASMFVWAAPETPKRLWRGPKWQTLIVMIMIITAKATCTML